MTDTTEDTTATTEQTEAQAPTEQERSEAQSGFAAGFAKVTGQQPATEGKTEAKPETTETPATETAEATPAAEATPEPTIKDVLERIAALEANAQSVPEQIHKLAGHLGGMKSQLNALATAKAAAQAKGADVPTDREVQAALSNPEEWKRLKEDFPEWAGPVEAEFAALRKEIAAQRAPQPQPVDVDRIRAEAVEEAEERMALRQQHPNWKQDVKTPEFHAWLKAQNAETQALAGSRMAVDAIKLLDGYEEHRKQAQAKQAKKQEDQRRLERAVAPKGGAQPVSTAISPHDRFRAGFRRVAGTG